MVQSVARDAAGSVLDTASPVDPEVLAAIAADMAPLRPSGTVLTRAGVLSELYDIKVAMRTWYDKQPDQVLREASAYGARLLELWTECKELEPDDRTFTQLRTQRVQPVVEEIDRQLSIQRSRIAVSRQDLDMLR